MTRNHLKNTPVTLNDPGVGQYGGERASRLMAHLQQMTRFIEQFNHRGSGSPDHYYYTL